MTHAMTLEAIGEDSRPLSAQLRQLARRVRHNGYRHGMESFVIERENIADALEKLAEDMGI